MKSKVEILGRVIGKAEGILANQREGQWRWERKTAEMREEGESRLKMERAAEREKGSGEKMGISRMGKGKRGEGKRVGEKRMRGKRRTVSGKGMGVCKEESGGDEN